MNFADCKRGGGCGDACFFFVFGEGTLVSQISRITEEMNDFARNSQRDLVRNKFKACNLC